MNFNANAVLHGVVDESAAQIGSVPTCKNDTRDTLYRICSAALRSTETNE